MNPILIGILLMLARMIDVVLMTVKLKALMRGKKVQVVIIGAFEILIYTLGASQAFKYVSNPIVLAFYILGYCIGYYLGMIIDEKINKPIVQATVITDVKDWVIADELRKSGFGVTTNRGWGLEGARKKQLTILLDKYKQELLMNIVKKHDENAYVFIVDVKSVGMNNIGK